MSGSQVRHVRTLFISDIHLGSKAAKAEFLLDFLRVQRAETAYLVGDIAEGWRRAPAGDDMKVTAPDAEPSPAGRRAAVLGILDLSACGLAIDRRTVPVKAWRSTARAA